MNILQIFVFYIAFLLSVFFAFYIPGKLLIDRIPLNKKLDRITLALCAGMLTWGWQAYIFGYLGIRWASYIYLLVCAGYYVYKKKYPKKIGKISFAQIDVIAILLGIIGVVGQNLYYFQTGMLNEKGLRLSLFNNPDHFWHTSLIHEMIFRFPPHEPGMYGILIQNYHYWFNLITGELIRVFHLPLFPTQYMGIYVFGSIMLGLTAYILARFIYPSKSFSLLVLFFLYFGGDTTYWMSYFATGKFDFHVPTVIENGTLFMDNPPRAFSIVLALAGLYFLLNYLRTSKKNVTQFGLIAFLFGTLIGFKVYTGIALSIGLGIVSLYRFLVKKDYTLIIVSISAMVISLVVFLPVNAHSGGMIFLPFERPRDFITYKNLGFFDMELRWRVYLEHKNNLRLIQYGILMSIVYLVAQYGIKILGFIPIKKTLRILGNEMSIGLYVASLATILIGIFFSQRAHIADSFNFFLPASLLLTFIFSLHLSLLLEHKRKIGLIIITLVIIITIPRWFHEVAQVGNSLISQNESYISQDELKSYQFLKEKTPVSSLILVQNSGYFDSISAIVSIFSDRRMFLSGQGVILAHEVVDKKRENISAQIFASPSSERVNKNLKSAGISYIYFYNKEKMGIPITRLKGKKVFQNKAAVIYQIN